MRVKIIVRPMYERLAHVVVQERERLELHGVPKSWEEVHANGWPYEQETGIVFLYDDRTIEAFANAGWLVSWSKDDCDVAIRACKPCLPNKTCKGEQP